LPNPPRDTRTFRTSTGRAEFSAGEISSFTPDDDAYTMMTIRSHDQFNTTIYTENDRYRGISGSRRIILMSRDDMNERGFRTGQMVDISTTGVDRRMESDGWSVVPYDIPRGCVATYFPESNHLIPIESYAEGSFTPTSKSVSVLING
jgi:anaerobic selenocysteine-containing dehydrogenase